MLGSQARLGFGADLGAGQEAGVGSLWFFIATDGAAAAFIPALKLEGGPEVILELAPFLGVEIVHERDQMGMFKTIVTEELSDMRPVLLLDVSVIILAIGPTASEGHPRLAAREVLIELPVEELTAVVGVEAFEGKGSLALDVLEMIADGLAAFVPEGAQLSPAAEKIGKGEGINEIAGGGVAAMSNGVRFNMTGCSGVGWTAASRNALAQERAGFGRGESATWITHPHRS